MNKTIKGTLTSGVLAYDVKALVCFKDQDVLIEIKNIPKQRSTQQNAYYRGPVLEGAVEGIRYCFGERISKDNAHDVLRNKFLYKAILDTTTNKEIKMLLSTAELTSEEFTNYIEQVRSWLWQFCQINIENPDDYFISKKE